MALKELKKEIRHCAVSPFDFLMERIIYPTRYFPKGSLDSSHVMRLLNAKVQRVSVRMNQGVPSSMAFSMSKKTE